MKTPLCLLVMAASIAAAEPAFSNREWKPGTPDLTVATTARYDDSASAFEVKAGEKTVVPVIVDSKPAVGTHSYALMGEVKHEGVGGTGFLETWTSLGGNKAFSRTLGDYGPMAKLTGNSTWRDFILPMNLMGATTPVTQIEMNVVLPDGGTVWLRNLRLEPMDFGSGQSYTTLLVASAVLAVAVLWFVWRSRNRRSEDEIKRMMAADA